MSILFCTFVVQKETSSTTKPQDPEGHKIMENERIEELVNTAKAIEKDARFSALDEVRFKLFDKLRFYQNLLYSKEAWAIYLNSTEPKWEELRKLRYSLYAKERLIEEIGGMVYEIQHNE